MSRADDENAESCTDLVPLTPIGDGRDGTGRFLPGNRGGPGNPHARQVAALRSALLATVTASDLREMTTKLIALAKSGNVMAIKEVYDRTLGKPVEADLIERIEAMEDSVAAQHSRRSA